MDAKKGISEKSVRNGIAFDKSKDVENIEFEIDGSTVKVSDSIVIQIAYMTLLKIEGIIPLSSNKINKIIYSFLESPKSNQQGVSLHKEVDEKGREKLKLSIEISVIYGYNIDQLIKKIKEEVSKSVSKMINREIEVANIKVVGIVSSRSPI